MVEDLTRHIEFWIALLPEQQRENLTAWMERHSWLICGRAIGDVREFLAALPDGHINEAFILLGEIAWQWRHANKEEYA
jgi:hypothetical protein